MSEGVFHVSCDLCFPTVSIVDEFSFVIYIVDMISCSELIVGAHYYSVHRARLLAISTVYTLSHIDVVSSCLSGSIWPWFSLNADSVCRACCFA